MDDPLTRLNRIKNSSNPLCPFLEDKEVFKRLDGPHTLGKDWAKEQAAENRKIYLDEDDDIKREIFENKRQPRKYSLKHKLRDHVSDIFDGLASIDDRANTRSIAKSSYVFGDRMKKELDIIESGNRKQSNEYSHWAEQRARAKQLGLASK